MLNCNKVFKNTKRKEKFMKNAQKMTRFLLILLALAMMLASFAACATEDEDSMTITDEGDVGDE